MDRVIMERNWNCGGGGGGGGGSRNCVELLITGFCSPVGDTKPREWSCFDMNHFSSFLDAKLMAK